MITVMATIEVQEGKADDFIKEYRKALPKVMKDPGAIAYVLHKDVSNPNKFYFYEKYADQEAIKYHTSTPHFKEFFGTIGPYIKGAPVINTCQEI